MKRLAAALAANAAVLGLMSWNAAASAQVQSCGNHPLTVQLLAHGTIAAGAVTVSNDATTLHVTVTTTGAYKLSQVDVAVGAALTDIPQAAGQGPVPSQFPYRMSFSPAATSKTFDIPLGSTVIGSTLFIAAHAVVGVPCQSQKSAWGAGQLFPGSQACSQGGGPEGDDGDDDHAEGGDRAATLRATGHGDHEGDGCSSEHGDGSHAAFRGSWSDHGGEDPCGGDHHGDGSRALGRGRGHNSDGGHDGHDGHDGDDDEGCGSAKHCGATYFVYVVNCSVE